MAPTPSLEATLVQGRRQQRNGLALRHRHTGAWLLGGRLHSRAMRLGAWAPCIVRRARSRPSPVRRWRRGRARDRSDVHPRDGPRLHQALRGGVDPTLDGAREPSRWWHPYGLVRLSGLERGRAGPWVWSVRAPGRALVV
jgi:hypothetical protein